MSVLGEQQLQKGSVCITSMHYKHCKNDNFCIDSLIAHMHSTLIKAIGCVTGVIELLWLPSMTSKRSHLVKRLFFIGASV